MTSTEELKIPTLSHLPTLEKGRVVAEIPPRFLVVVEVLGRLLEAYVPFSSKVSNHVEFIGAVVAVSFPDGTARARVELLYLDGQWVLLNLSLVEKLLGGFLTRTWGGPGELRSQVLLTSGYRADFASLDEVIETKTVLSNQSEVQYPMMRTQRAEHQLERLIAMVRTGVAVTVIFVLLHRSISTVHLNPKAGKFESLFREAMAHGCKVRFFQLDITTPDLFYDVSDKTRFEQP